MTSAPLSSGSAILAGVLTFFGATGLLAGTGFLVEQSLFVFLGAPSPPFATIDYLRVAGYFLFDLIVVVLLLNGVLWGVTPALFVLISVSLILFLWPPRVRTRAKFNQRYGAAWRWIEERWHKWLTGWGGLTACLILLVVFTFAYHYPVFAQRGIAEVPMQPQACRRPGTALDLSLVPVVWGFVERRCAAISSIIRDQDQLAKAQETYSNGVLFLLILALYALHHPYSQLRRTGRGLHSGWRWLWSVTAALLVISLAYLPGGYAVLFLDKQLPVVKFDFKESGSGDAKAVPAGPSRQEAWRDSVLDKSWYLLFQNEKEVWIFRTPNTVVLQKDQLGGMEIRGRHWILD